MEGTANAQVLSIRGKEVLLSEDVVVREKPYTLFLNDTEFVTLVCSPGNIQELAIGLLCAEGILRQREDLLEVKIHEGDGLVWVETKEKESAAVQTFLKRFLTTCCGRGRAAFYFLNDAREMRPVEAKLSVSAEQICRLSRKLEDSSLLFAATGGAHAAALCTQDDILLLFEDIGRHNALDKIFGRCFLGGIETDDKLIVFSGRVSSEILVKVARMRVSVLVARGAPTDLALEMAEGLGITVVGFARGEKMNVYTHRERVRI